jgi:uncharacterized protein involved in response to NO
MSGQQKISPADQLRSQPYRLFFPLGVVLAWAGVGQWLLFSSGLSEAYLSIFHSMAQVQGFLICFAMGFLFTMVPRRTSSLPASLATLLLCALCPVATVVAAWFEFWPLAQFFWIILLVTLSGFVVRRMRGGARRPPVAFLWIPIAVAFGLGGSVLTGIGASVGSLWALHEIGRGLVLQGFFLCLVLGVGSFVVPLFTRGEGLPDDSAVPRVRQERAFHLIAATVLLASFVLESQLSMRAGFTLRALVLWTVLLEVGQIYRPPTKPGVLKWLVWIGAWCVPLGYTLGAIFPVLGKGALHVTFLGGFGLLVFSVSSQVILGHGGWEALRDGRPVAPVVVAVCLLIASVARIAMELQPDRLLLWMSGSASAFLLASLVWAGFVLPKLVTRAEV